MQRTASTGVARYMGPANTVTRRMQGPYSVCVTPAGAVRRMRTRIRLLAQPESMRSIIGATQ